MQAGEIEAAIRAAPPMTLLQTQNEARGQAAERLLAMIADRRLGLLQEGGPMAQTWVAEHGELLRQFDVEKALNIFELALLRSRRIDQTTEV